MKRGSHLAATFGRANLIDLVEARPAFSAGRASPGLYSPQLEQFNSELKLFQINDLGVCLILRNKKPRSLFCLFT